MVVFDTEALLIFYLNEDGADVVESLLEKIFSKKINGFINIINLTEFYYIVYRMSPEKAEEKVRNLKAYGLEVVPLTYDTIWKEAGKIKGRHAISLADAFAVATALFKNDKLVVGRDTDFERLGVQLIKVGG